MTSPFTAFAIERARKRAERMARIAAWLKGVVRMRR